MAITHYMKGLRSNIYHRLIEHRSDMRNLPLAAAGGVPNPSWDFVSFKYAIMIALQQLQPQLIIHLQHLTLHHINVKVVNMVLNLAKGKLFCKYHPNSTTHHTKDCRNPGTTSPTKDMRCEDYIP